MFDFFFMTLLGSASLCIIIKYIILSPSKFPLTKFHYHSCDEHGNSEDILVTYKGRFIKNNKERNLNRLKQNEDFNSFEN